MNTSLITTLSQEFEGRISSGLARFAVAVAAGVLVGCGPIQEGPNHLVQTTNQSENQMQEKSTTIANPGVTFSPAPVVPLASQPPARLIVDAPLPAQLATGYVVIRYKTENLRIMPVYGPSALSILPRIGHLHITVDDLPWHWLDSSGEPLSINGLPPGPHKVLIELETPTHQLIDAATISFEVPERRKP